MPIEISRSVAHRRKLAWRVVYSLDRVNRRLDMAYVKVSNSSDTESSDEDLIISEIEPSTSQAPCILPAINNNSRTLATVKNVRIDNSHGVNVGDTIINQTISNGDVVQARFLCLQFESTLSMKRFRCSLAVFLCWSLIVASSVVLYVVIFVIPQHTPRMDLDVPLPQYLWKVMKSTTRFERVSCAVVSLLVIFSITILLYYFLAVAPDGRDKDPAPAEWYITRQMWLAKDWNDTKSTTDFQPIKLVVIQHSVSHLCYKFKDCASNLRTLQDTFFKNHNEDVPYNFLIGNEGRVYEGRGWGKVGDHSLRFNPCSVSIGFIGDYRYIPATAQQLNRTRLLLARGVKEGFLHPNYVVVGAKDIRDSESPGVFLYEAIKKLDHYDHENRYRDMVCEQIYAPNGFEFRDDEAPWYISRQLWDAKPFENTNSTAQYEPLRVVIINNSESRVCYSFAVCRIEMQNLQNWFFLMEEDIYYNFLIGNDGRVYEGRGWGLDGALKIPHIRHCALSIGFVGDYSKESQFQTRVTESQLNSTQRILAQGVEGGHLHPDYVVVGARDVVDTTSPGFYLYEAIKQWEHYESDFRYRNLTCDQIHSL